MTEKKRVAVVVDASVMNECDAPSAFNFQDFQGQFYAAASDHAAAEAASANPEEVCAYDARKTSIIEGVSCAELVQQHRMSLAGIGRGAVPVEELAGVTLSRRHTQSKTEYTMAANGETYQQLEGFTF